jgi:hypothetical protein
MERTFERNSEWIEDVRREFTANETVRRAFRAALDRRDLGWSFELSWPQTLAPRAFPRIIWMYWEQGWHDAPEIVARCADSWARHNPEWEIRRLDRDGVRAYADVDEIVRGKTMSVQAFSDVLRLALLERHGGVWVDANTVCRKPLDHWLPPLMQSGFFAFAKPRPDRLIATWFLASEPRGRIIGAWFELVRRYWSVVSEADVYLWCHYLFSYACRTNDVFAAGWAATPHVRGYGPLQPQLLKFGADVEREAIDSVAAGAIPVWKLTHGAQMPADSDDSALASLIRLLLAS